MEEIATNREDSLEQYATKNGNNFDCLSLSCNEIIYVRDRRVKGNGPCKQIK